MKINQELARITLQRLGMNGNELQDRLMSIQEEVLQDKKQIIAVYPDWDPKKDARITSLNNLFNILGRARLQIQLLGELLNDDWWQTNARQTPQERKKELLVSIEQSIKFSFGMDFFSGVEISFRMFLRALDPGACKEATGPFNAIYDCLLGSKQLNFPSSDKATAKELLNLTRLIRNLIHNGGIYFDQDGVDKKVTYRGKEYDFRHGEPVRFVYWDLLLMLADDIRQLLVQVISHSKIATQVQIADLHRS